MVFVHGLEFAGVPADAQADNIAGEDDEDDFEGGVHVLLFAPQNPAPDEPEAGQ